MRDLEQRRVQLCFDEFTAGPGAQGAADLADWLVQARAYARACPQGAPSRYALYSDPTC